MHSARGQQHPLFTGKKLGLHYASMPLATLRQIFIFHGLILEISSCLVKLN